MIDRYIADDMHLPHQFEHLLDMVNTISADGSYTALLNRSKLGKNAIVESHHSTHNIVQILACDWYLVEVVAADGKDDACRVGHLIG